MARVTLSVTSADGGARLDVFVARASGVSRQIVQRACELEQILVNEQVTRAGQTLRSGDVVTVLERLAPAEARPTLAKQEGVRFHRASGERSIGESRPASVDIDVLYEDEHLVIVYKPRAMHSVTNDGNDSLTLADCLGAYHPAFLTASSDRREAGLVQRLDFFTEGVIVAAKQRNIWNKLHEMLLGNEIKKRYFAVVERALPQKKLHVERVLMQEKSGKRMILSSDSADDHTRFSTESQLEQVGAFRSPSGERRALVSVTTRRTRRHQVRLHLASVGTPLVGDETYGSKSSIAELGLNDLRKPNEGFLLLASSITFTHPVGGKVIELNAKAPWQKKLELWCQ